MHFEIYQEGSTTDSDTHSDVTAGAWRWRLKCADHQTITGGESYVDHAACLRAVYLLRKTSSQTGILDV